MAFVLIQDIPLAIADGGARQEIREIGESSRAVDGTLRKTRVTSKKSWNLETNWLDPEDAKAWLALIRGEGHVVGFDSTLQEYSSKGLPPTSGSYTVNASGGKFGGCVTLPATTGTIVYTPAGLGSEWTVAVFRYETATWNHYVVDSSARKWMNGTRNDALSTTWLSVSSGVVTLANVSGSAVDYDELTILPFVGESTEFGAYWSLNASTQWADLPRLKLQVSGGTVCTVVGSVADVQYEQASVNGTWTVLQKLSLMFEEV